MKNFITTLLFSIALYGLSAITADAFAAGCTFTTQDGRQYTLQFNNSVSESDAWAEWAGGNPNGGPCGGIISSILSASVLIAQDETGNAASQYMSIQNSQMQVNSVLIKAVSNMGKKVDELQKEVDQLKKQGK